MRLERADVGLEAIDARKARAALIEIERGIVVAGVDRRAVAAQRVRLGRAAVVLQRFEHRVGRDRVVGNAERGSHDQIVRAVERAVAAEILLGAGGTEVVRDDRALQIVAGCRERDAAATAGIRRIECDGAVLAFAA